MATSPFRFNLGALECYILNDGIFMLDGGSVFGRVPRSVWERVVPPDHLNRLPLSLNAFLLVAGGKRILIETGYGDKLTEKELTLFGIARPHGTLLDQLALLGLGPADIDIVINTHLHGDHAGWNTRRPADDPAGEPVPTFPNARYVVQRQEWEDATHPNLLTAPGYQQINLLPLGAAGVLDLVEGETRVLSEVRLVPTPGHTAGHQSIWVESGDRAALFTGDAAIYGLHLERINWVGAVDNFPITSVATRERLVSEILSRQASVIVTHHPFPGLGSLTQAADEPRPRFIPVAE